MISTAATLTDAGRDLLLRGVCGEQIVFTHFAVGNGLMNAQRTEKDMTELISERLQFPIVGLDMNALSGYAKMEGRFDNTSVADAFRWTELGVFARGEKRTKFSGNGSSKTFVLTDKPAFVNSVLVGTDRAVVSGYDASTGTVTLAAAPANGVMNVTVYYPDNDEILYAYTNSGKDGGVIAGADSGIMTEQMVTLIVAIGSAQHITAIIGESAQYASKDDFNRHITDPNNPHGITKDHVGLSNVENKAISDQTPVFADEQSEDVVIKSGEKLSKILGKISSVIRSVVSHVSNHNNPHHVTAEQIGSAELIVGTFNGDGKKSRLIQLDFMPRVVFLADSTGMMGDDIKGTCGGIMTRGFNLVGYGQDSYDNTKTEWNSSLAGMITNEGFIVNCGNEKVGTNVYGRKYIYIAVK